MATKPHHDIETIRIVANSDNLSYILPNTKQITPYISSFVDISKWSASSDSHIISYASGKSWKTAQFLKDAEIYDANVGPSNLLSKRDMTAKKTFQVDEDDISAMRAIFENISYKNIINDDAIAEDRRKTHELQINGELLTNIPFQLISSTELHVLSIPAGTLGLVMVVFFVGLLVTTIISGIVYIQPVIAVGGVIAGVTFLAMQSVSRRGAMSK